MTVEDDRALGVVGLPLAIVLGVEGSMLIIDEHEVRLSGQSQRGALNDLLDRKRVSGMCCNGSSTTQS